MRALLDKQEYVGGDGQVLHVRFPSKQPGESNVKIIGRRGMLLNRLPYRALIPIEMTIDCAGGDLRHSGDGWDQDLLRPRLLTR